MIRTCDPLRVKREAQGYKDLPGNDLQGGENSVTPNVTPEIQKAAILEALRSMGRDELRAVLVDLLTGEGDKGAGQ